MTKKRRGFGNLREATILERQRRREGDHPTKSCLLGFSRMRGIRRHRWHIIFLQFYNHLSIKKCRIGTAKQICEPTSSTFSFPREKRKKQSVSISSTEQRRRAMATPLTPNKVYSIIMVPFPLSPFLFLLTHSEKEWENGFVLHPLCCTQLHFLLLFSFPQYFFREKKKELCQSV